MYPFLLFVGLGLYWKCKGANCEEDPFNISEYGKRESGLPIYTRKQVSEKTTREKGFWVTFRHGVYDITDWIASHPGGNKILLAAGKDLGMFFDMYAVHKVTSVMDIMETYRVGNLHPADMKIVVNKNKHDPFSNDPVRHPALTMNSVKPFNAEPPNEIFLDDFYTPNEIFFVRNHLPVPTIGSKHALKVEGKGIRKPLNLTIPELKKQFKVHTIGATIQCGGNGRSEMAGAKPVRGLKWGTNAISNAKWTGVKLVDVLKFVGADEENCSHVIFQGADTDFENAPYEASIPSSTAFDPRRDVLLAWEMNGKELPRDHGYPLRVIIPGVVGARNVKWLNKIVLSDTESQSHHQQEDYKTFNPSTDWDTVNWNSSRAIQETPVTSAINEPINGSTVDEDDEDVTVKGYAWSGGGQGIIRVDVSVDGGKSWVSAELTNGKQKLHREWSWTLWEVTVPIPKQHNGRLNIVCKAVDTSHNTQPESPNSIWNLRGMCNNSWSRVHINVSSNLNEEEN